MYTLQSGLYFEGYYCKHISTTKSRRNVTAMKHFTSRETEDLKLSGVRTLHEAFIGCVTLEFAGIEFSPEDTWSFIAFFVVVGLSRISGGFSCSSSLRYTLHW